jgi:hypothetical protein
MDLLDEKQRRKRLASLPFPEKIKIVERLRRVSDAAGKSGLRKRKTLESSQCEASLVREALTRLARNEAARRPVALRGSDPVAEAGNVDPRSL